MPTHFDIETKTKELSLAEGQRNVIFSVTNKTGREIRARATIRPRGGAQESWFRISDAEDRVIEEDGVYQYVVTVEPPGGTPPGKFSFRLVVQDVEEPDDVFDEGPAVELLVGPSDAPKPAAAERAQLPWLLLVGVAAGLVVVTAVVVFLIARSTDKQEGPTGGPFLELKGGILAGDLVLEPEVDLSCAGCIDTDELADAAVVPTKLGGTCSNGQVLKFVDGAWSCGDDVAGSGVAPPPASPEITGGSCPPGQFLAGLTTKGAPQCAAPPAAPTFSGGSCPAGQVMSGVSSSGEPQCRAVQLDCRIETSTFTGTETSVRCPSGMIATGGGWELSDGNRNDLNWNDAAAHPRRADEFRCMRNIGNGSSVCHVICCNVK